MTRVITYTLTLEEPCLLAAPGGDPNTESSLSYVPGGALRGALAAAWLRAGGDSGSQAFKDLFLNGKVRYLNAYPLLNERTLPTPRAWTQLKDKGDQVYNRAEKDQRDTVDGEILSGVGATFVTFGASIETAAIAYEIAIHTARNRRKGRSIEGDADSALFRYRALARDQAFAGAVVVDDGVDAGPLEELLGDKMLLGGSQTAGYGLCRVSADKPAEEPPSPWREVGGAPAAIPAGALFIVYLAGHAILYHPDTGQPTNDICLFLPGGPNGNKIKESFAAMTWVGGFNKHRGLPLSQQWAVQMGSTWVIETHNGITADQINELEQKGIGARTEEGFGRLLFDPQWPQQPFEIAESTPAATQPPATVSTPEDKLLTRMNERIARAELDRLLAVKVNQLAEKGKIHGRLSRSQLGRLQVRIRHEAKTKDFGGFLKYLEGTTKRKSADDQFRKYTVGGKNFRKRLEGLTTNPQTVWDEIIPKPSNGEKTWQPSHIGQQPVDYKTDELAHAYTVKFIANLCRQLSKLEDDQ